MPAGSSRLFRLSTMKRFALMLSLFVACSLGAARPPQRDTSDAQMQVFQSKYYVIHTDLPIESVKEAVVRMNKMAEEYHARTRGFSGDIREKMPFYLFRDRRAYYEAGGLPGSAGVFDGSKLMAIAGEQTTARTWHVVQHEGFHQFAHAVIRGELPTWLNEGIAEYFGESLFTGDAFVSGVIPPWRLKRLQDEIKTGQLKSLKQMMLTTHEEWNGALSIQNYDQAWSMVQFLAHGENGKYQEAFVSFMRLIGRGIPWQIAWKQTFGDAAGFELRWRDYWLKIPADPTHALYVQAVAETLNSYLARATIEKQRFENFDEFLAAAKASGVKTPDTMEEWLPTSLEQEAAEAASDLGANWSLSSGADHTPQMSCDLPDGTRITGSYVIRGGHLVHAGIDIDDTASLVKQATDLIEQGRKQQARELLQRALRSHPKSPAAAQARELIAQTK